MSSPGPIRCVVLAAGYGKRLRPLTDIVPKPLVPLFTVPMVELALLRLRTLGPRLGPVAVNLHHLPDALERHLGDGHAFGVDIRYSDERGEILGTGGALRALESFLTDDPFLVLNGDVVFDAPPSRLVELWHEWGRPAAVVGLARDDAQPHLHLVARDEDTGLVVSIGDRPAPAPSLVPRWIFAGMHLLTREVFEALPPAGFACAVRDGYVPLLTRGSPVLGVPFAAAAWHDVGTPAAYLEAHRALFGALPGIVAGAPSWRCEEVAPGIFEGPDVHIGDNVELRPPVVLGAGCRIERGAMVGPETVVGERAQILAGAEVRRSVVWPDCVVDGTIDRAIATQASTILTETEAVR